MNTFYGSGIEYNQDVVKSTYTTTNIYIVIMLNDWTARAAECRDLAEIYIPEYAAVNAEYNPNKNETHIRFTWSTIEIGIIPYYTGE